MAYDNRVTWLTTVTIGVVFGFATFEHGLFELLQGNVPTNGVVINAIGESHRFYPAGTEPAFTIMPTFAAAGIASMVVGLTIIVWSLSFLRRPHGRTIFLMLFLLSFLVGGGIGQVAFFIPAWAFGTRIDKPLNWWKSVLSPRTRPVLARLWRVFLPLSTISIVIGIELAVFGFLPGLTDPTKISNIAGLFVMASAVLNLLSYVTALAADLHEREVLSSPALSA